MHESLNPSAVRSGTVEAHATTSRPRLSRVVVLMPRARQRALKQALSGRGQSMRELIVELLATRGIH